MKAAAFLCLGRMIERLSVDLEPDACKTVLAIVGDAVLHLGELAVKSEAAEGERHERFMKVDELARLSERVQELEAAALNRAAKEAGVKV